MPFVSQAQRAWMYANHPNTMARRWEAHTPKGKKLPRHVSDSSKVAASSQQLVLDDFSSSEAAADLSHVPAGLLPAGMAAKVAAILSDDLSKGLGLSKQIGYKPRVLQEEQALNAAKPLNQFGPTPGMSMPGQQPQQPGQPAQPAQPPTAANLPLKPPSGPVSPSSHPINTYGPISMSGDINGNAAFGVKHSTASAKLAGFFGPLLARAGRIARGIGAPKALAQTAVGAGAGAGLTALENQTGVVDPNMSGEGQQRLLMTNVGLGALIGNPYTRKRLFFKRHVATGGKGLSPSITANSMHMRLMPTLGTLGVLGIAPTAANSIDATAKATRKFQDALNDTQHPERTDLITNPSGYFGRMLGQQTDKVLNSEPARVFMSELGRNAAGMAGGGVAGYLAGRGLSSAVAPDDETLDYKSRRRRERLRGLITMLGSAAGGIGGPMLLASLPHGKTAAEKQAASPWAKLLNMVANPTARRMGRYAGDAVMAAPGAALGGYEGYQLSGGDPTATALSAAAGGLAFHPRILAHHFNDARAQSGQTFSPHGGGGAKPGIRAAFGKGWTPSATGFNSAGDLLPNMPSAALWNVGKSVVTKGGVGLAAAAFPRVNKAIAGAERIGGNIESGTAAMSSASGKADAAAASAQSAAKNIENTSGGLLSALQSGVDANKASIGANEMLTKWGPRVATGAGVLGGGYLLLQLMDRLRGRKGPAAAGGAKRKSAPKITLKHPGQYNINWPEAA